MSNPIITIVGGVVREPELRFIKTGKAVASLTVVTKDAVEQGGEWHDKNVTYYKVTVWEKQAEQLAEAGLVPGTEVIVVGKLHLGEWEKDDGTKVQQLELNAYSLGVAITKWSTARPVRADRSEVKAGGVDPWSTPDKQEAAEPSVAPF